MGVCDICARTWKQHPISGEWTCFVHGRPDGSVGEREIWKRFITRKVGNE